MVSAGPGSGFQCDTHSAQQMSSANKLQKWKPLAGRGPEPNGPKKSAPLLESISALYMNSLPLSLSLSLSAMFVHVHNT